MRIITPNIIILDFEEFIKCPTLVKLKLSLKVCGGRSYESYDTRDKDLVKGLQVSLMHFVNYFDALKPINYKYDNPHILLTYINIFGRLLEDNKQIPQNWHFIEETPLKFVYSHKIIDDTISRQDDIFHLFSAHLDALKNSRYEGGKENFFEFKYLQIENRLRRSMIAGEMSVLREIIEDGTYSKLRFSHLVEKMLDENKSFFFPHESALLDKFFEIILLNSEDYWIL